MIALDQIAVGLGMVILTTMVHALFMVSGNHFAERDLSRHGRARSNLSKAVRLSGLTAWQFLAVITGGLIWALLYRLDPAITMLPDLETALYFSMVTFTTVGYGDIVLTGKWRVLASFQAANGMIIFGWSTALIFYYIQRIYGQE